LERVKENIWEWATGAWQIARMRTNIAGPLHGAILAIVVEI
jgi:hypothetical protein